MRTQKFVILLTAAQIIIVGLSLSLPAPAQEPVTLPPSLELPAGMVEPPVDEAGGFFTRAENIIGDVWLEIARPPLAWFDWITLAAGALIILIGRWKSWRESARGEFNSDKLRPFAQFALCLLLLFAAVDLAHFLGHTDEFLIIGDIQFQQTERESFDDFFNTGQRTLATTQGNPPGQFTLVTIQGNQAAKPASVGLKLARGFLDLSVFILTLLGFLLSAGLRLAAPVVIALALDRRIPGRSLLRHGWGVCASSMIWPLLSFLLPVFAYLSRDLAMYFRERTLGGEVIAIIVMVSTGLFSLAIPGIFYKLIVGQGYESVSAAIAACIVALACLWSKRASERSGSIERWETRRNETGRLQIESPAQVKLVSGVLDESEGSFKTE